MCTVDSSGSLLLSHGHIRVHLNGSQSAPSSEAPGILPRSPMLRNRARDVRRRATRAHAHPRARVHLPPHSPLAYGFGYIRAAPHV